MNFKNMSIKKSLIVGFGTTILISAVIIIASLIMTNSQKNAYTNIMDDYVGATALISECRIDYNIAARTLRDVVLSGETGELADVLSKVDELKLRIDELEAVYPLQDRTLLTSFTKTVDEWEIEAQAIVELARTDREAAAGRIATSCSPKLRAAAVAGDQLSDALTTAQNTIIERQTRKFRFLLHKLA